ncbi:MAG TPA: hypothetical protein VG821_00480 [Rhizomicrobium sp.]|jgi:hypothetical protein|nr:hypothetical protein [Rhizomicrobium sp.]
MSAEPDQKAPPYSSKTSFENYLNHLRDNPPLPTRIDKGVMSHLNYGTRQALVGSLRYLKLMGKDDVPTPRLEKLLKATGADRTALLKEIVSEAYPYLFDGSMALDRVSPHEFEEKFKREAGVNGSTAEKAIAFFLGIAADAGVNLSPHLTKRKASPTGPRKPKVKREKREEAPPPPNPNVNQNNGNGGDITNQLLAKFPPFDPAWPDPIKTKWFEGFEKLMKSSGAAKD